jgi:hypothetical protein
VAPSADELDLASSGSLYEEKSVYNVFRKRGWASRTNLVIFGVDVEPSDALDVLPGGVLGYT